MTDNDLLEMQCWSSTMLEEMEEEEVDEIAETFVLPMDDLPIREAVRLPDEDTNSRRYKKRPHKHGPQKPRRKNHRRNGKAKLALGMT